MVAAVRVAVLVVVVLTAGTAPTGSNTATGSTVKMDETGLSPQVIWASQPTFGGQTVQIFGSGLGGTSSVTVAPLGAAGTTNISAPAFDVSRSSFKVTLPASLPDAVYQLCITAAAPAPAPAPAPAAPAAAGTTSTCVTLNAPDVWWLRGDVNLSHATPGGWVRVFGRLGDEGQRLASLVLVLGAHELMRHNGSANDALFMLPATLPTRPYPIKLRVAGVTIPVVDPAALIVAPKSMWPGSGNVIPVNTTHQLWAALNQTRLHGGGTILMQRGTYAFTTESIDLPDHTTLRGVSTAAVHLVWHTAKVNQSAVPKYFVGGNATFAVEDLTISCDRFYHDIITDGYHHLPNSEARGFSRGVRIRRVRIRADSFTRLMEAGTAFRGVPGANFDVNSIGSGINLNGQEYEVTDCDIYSSGHGIYLGHDEQSLNHSASVGLVQRNLIQFGTECYQIDSSSQVVFEDNECVGINLLSRGSAAGATYNGPAAIDIVFQRNSIRFLFGGDGEELTMDGGWSPLNGRGVTVDGSNVTFPRDPVYPLYCSPPGNCRNVHVDWTGAAMYVLGGQGAGQMRVFAGGGLGYNRTWTLEKPFGGSGGGVPINADSFISVFERREHMIIRDNHFFDGGPMQMYGGMRHAVVSNNTFVRTDGTLVWGLKHKGNALMPCYFIEHFRNRVSDRRLQGLPGGFRALGFYNASNDFNGPMAVGLVYRDNYVDDGTWNIGGAVTDVILEGNTMVNSRQCGTVGPGCLGEQCGPCEGGCCDGLQIMNGKQPDGTTNVTTVFRVFLRNNSGLCADLARKSLPVETVSGCGSEVAG